MFVSILSYWILPIFPSASCVCMLLLCALHRQMRHIKRRPPAAHLPKPPWINGERATERAASGRWERGGIIFRNIEILEISIGWGPKNRSSESDPEAWRFRAFSSRIWDFFGGLFYIKLYIGRDLYTDPRWIVLEVAAQKCETFDDQWKTGCNLRESIAAPPSLFGFFG